MGVVLVAGFVGCLVWGVSRGDQPAAPPAKPLIPGRYSIIDRSSDGSRVAFIMLDFPA